MKREDWKNGGDDVPMAVSVLKEEAVFVPGLPAMASVFEVIVQSKTPSAGFRLRTAPLIDESQRKFRLLKDHGFTVVACSERDARTLSYDTDVRERIILDATNQVTALYDGGKIIMSEYNDAFAQDVLGVLAASFPKRVQMMEIKSALTPEPSDDELLNACDGLLLEGYIHGAPMRSHIGRVSRLIALADIVLTKEGRQHLQHLAAPNEGFSVKNMHFHGPVGAVGHHSTGIVNQHLHSSMPEPDWNTLRKAFDDELAFKRQSAATADDYLALSHLATAGERAREKDQTGLIEVVKTIGKAALPVLARAGAQGLVSYCEQHFGWKLE